MNTHELSLTEKALDLYKMKKKKPGFFKTPAPKRPVGRPVKRETILKILRKTTADINAPEQLQLLARQLTGGGQGMKLKEFRYYPYPGNPYGNPEDFAREREKERRNGLIKAGLIGAGILGGGGLLARGLYKVGASAAVRRADDLERELVKLRSAKPASEVDVPAPAPKPRGRPKSELPPAPPPQVAPPPPPPTPPPQPPPSAAAEVEEVLNAAKGAKAPKAPKAAKSAPAPAKEPSPAANAPVYEDFGDSSERLRAASRNAAAKGRAAARARMANMTEAQKKQFIVRERKKKRQAAQAANSTPVETPAAPTPAPAAPAAVSTGSKATKPMDSAIADKFAAEMDGAAPKSAAPKKAASKSAPAAAASGREYWEKDGVKFPLTGKTAAELASERAEYDKLYAAGAFKGKTAGDVADEVREKLKSTPAAAKPEAKPAAKAKGKKSAAAAKEEPAPEAKVPKWKQRLEAKQASGGGKKRSAKKLAAILRGVREFNFQTDEGGIPFTGKVAKDRFIKKLRDEDLDRRDANILRAGATGALAGLLFRGRLSAGKRALIGAGIGGAGVIGTRMATDRTRDIYGERSRGAKRAEALPALAGLGAAGWLATRRIRGLAAKIRGVKEFARGKYAIPALGKMLKDQSILEEFMTGHRGPKLGELNIVRDMKTKLAGNPKLARVLAKRNIDLGPGRLTQKNTDARNWAADALRRGKKGGAILTPENHLRVGPLDVMDDIWGRRPRGPKSYIVWPPRNLETTDLSARLRGVKEFGSMGLGKLYRKKAALLKRGLFIEKLNPSTGKVLYREQRPLISDRERYAGIYRRLANKGPKGPNLPPWKQDVPVGGKLQSPYDGKMQQELKYDEVMRRHEKKVRGFSARLRGLKEFDDYKLYYFRGRNTGIAARSAEEARKKKKRGGDELVAVRTPNATEKSQMARGIWVRTRRDGKSPGQSRYGKGRGQGPARKSMGAKLRGMKEFGSMGLQKLYRKRAAIVREGLMTRGRGVDGTLGAATSKLVEQHPRLEWKRGAAIDRWLKWKNSPPMPAGEMPSILLSARHRAIKFFEKKKEKKSGGLNPYVGAALSGFGSGAALGSLALLRRGATFRSAAKTAAKLGIASAGIVGGGALLGSKIIGNPRDDESAPFTKRAAIGGALVGSGAGLAGALLLRKTKGGARALVGASKKTEPFSRPAMWLRKTPLVGAAGIGAVGGALYGGAMGADEGQQVDSIRNLRKDIKAHGLSRRLGRLREFGIMQGALRWYRGENLSGVQRLALAGLRKGDSKAAANLRKAFVQDNRQTNRLVLGAGILPPVATTAVGVGASYHSSSLGRKKELAMKLFGRGDQPRYARNKAWAPPVEAYAKDIPLVDNQGNPWNPSSPQLANALWRDASKARVGVQRGGRLTKDVSDVIQGKDRERDASGRIKKREWEKSWFQNALVTGALAGGLGGTVLLRRWARNNPRTAVGAFTRNVEAWGKRRVRDGQNALANAMGGLGHVTSGPGKTFAARLAKLREFDAVAAAAGWDARDPRGRSVRVFAPGSRRRDRREKAWHEKSENERKLWKAGIAAGIVGGGLAGIGLYRIGTGRTLIPRFGDAAAGAKSAVQSSQVKVKEMLDYVKRYPVTKTKPEKPFIAPWWANQTNAA